MPSIRIIHGRGSTGYFDLQYGKIALNEEGLYQIIDKDRSINDRIGDPGNVHACRHANGRDWWMLQFTRDTVYTYLIDPNSIQLSHLQFLPFELQHANRGQSKFNQQGTRFALTHVIQSQLPDGMEIFIADFDRSSGNLYNHTTTKINSNNTALEQGLEFSPSGRYLYVSKPEFVYQIDMNNYPIINLEEVAYFPEELCELDMFFLNSFGQMQLGPDNKIYIGRISQCFDIHIINHPERPGVACDVQRNAIKLPTYTDGTIPTFNTYRLGPLDGSPSDTLGLNNNPVSRFWYEQDSIDFLTSQFWDVSYFRPESWEWNFGDGNSSMERHPLHSYTEKGIYEVCLTVSNENSSNTSCQTINLGIVSNTQKVEKFDISVFPNPISDYLRLTFHDYLPQNASVIFYDVSGASVLNHPLSGGANILDLNLLESGTYVFEIRDQGIVIGSGKVVKI